MTASLATKAINTQEITDKARRDLLQLLEAVRGKKNLVIDRTLVGTIGLFVKFSTLQEYGVDKVFFLDSHNVDSSQRNIIFLVRGEKAKKIRTVAEQIRLVRAESKVDHEFTIIWVPRRTLVSNLVLEEHGTLGEANITNFPLHLIPLEQDLLSLELDDCFSDLFLRKDPTPIHASAQALMLLQKQYGLFPRILGKGNNAKKLADLLLRMRNEEDVDSAANPNNTYLTSFGLITSSLVENLVVIDREVDFPTILATQLTYEGLLDEIYAINNNGTEIDNSVLGGAATSSSSSQQGTTTTTSTVGTKRRVQLDSSDKLYPAIRNANFATIGPILNQTARRVMSDQDNIRNPNLSIPELTKAVSTLPSLQAEQASLKIHTNIAEDIMKFTRSDIFRRTLEVEQNLLAGSEPNSMHDTIEELIARDVPLRTVLRLLCLESCLSNGIRQRELEHFRRQILLAYGFEHVLTLANLEKMGLLVAKESHRGYLNPIAGAAGQTATDWNAIRRSLTLWVDEVQESDPNDIAYVFSGAAPLSVRLVQCVLQKSYIQNLAASARAGGPTPTPSTANNNSNSAGSIGWTGFADPLSRIRGSTVDVAQKGHDVDAAHARRILHAPAKDGPRVTIVFFLGGVTYAEIAAIRFLSKQLEASSGRKIVIATTNVINGKKAVGAAVEERRLGGDES